MAFSGTYPISVGAKEFSLAVSSKFFLAFSSITNTFSLAFSISSFEGLTLIRI
jgi:hypothetical protein